MTVILHRCYILKQNPVSFTGLKVITEKVGQKNLRMMFFPVYTEKNNRVKKTQSRVSNGRGVNVTHVVRRVDSNIVILPCQ